MHIPITALYYEIRKCARFQFGYIIAKYNALPLFTQMEDDSNLRLPPEKRLPRENVFFQISNDIPKIKCLLNKYFTTQGMSDTIYLFQSLSLSPLLQSMPLSSSHSLLTSTTYHLSHSLHCILKISGEMRCHAIMIQTD